MRISLHKQVKNITAILLSLLISYSWIAKAVIFFDFQLNKQQIIAEKCENKKKPQRRCNGKCFLAKQLNKTEEKSKQLPASVYASKIEVFSPVVLFQLNEIQFISPQYNISPAGFTATGFSDALLRPPARLV